MQAYLIYLLAIPLLFFLLFKEWKRENKARKWWRMLASSTAVSCFIFLLVPTYYFTKTKNTNTNSPIILTEGFNKDSINKNTKFLSLNDSLISVNRDLKIRKINLKKYLINHPEISQIKIIGDGLDPDILAQIRSVKIQFYPNPVTGITAINWQKKINSGNELMVEGSFNNTDKKPLKIVLNSLATPVDSQILAPEKITSFTLKTIPKSLGRSYAELLIFDNNKQIQKERIAFEVLPKTQSRILILTANPGFEYKFLKNWLSQNQFQVAYRAAISKQKYQIEFANLSSFSLQNITSNQLKQFDILICDQQEINALSASEQNMILNQVKAGMGLLIIVSDVQKPIIKNNFYLKDNPTSSSTNRKLNLTNQNQVINLTNAGNLTLVKSARNVELIHNQNKQVIAAIRISGAGKIGATTLSNTYQWVLAGNQKNYENYWSLLIGESQKKSLQKLFFEMNTNIPVINEKLTATYITNDESPVKIFYNQNILAQLQHPVLPYKFTANLRPQKTGWQFATLADSITNWFYIYGYDDWKSVKRAEKIQLQKHFIKQHPVKEILGSKNTVLQKKPISKLWFLGLFLLAAGFLWFETKMLS